MDANIGRIEARLAELGYSLPLLPHRSVRMSRLSGPEIWFFSPVKARSVTVGRSTQAKSVPTLRLKKGTKSPVKWRCGHWPFSNRKSGRWTKCGALSTGWLGEQCARVHTAAQSDQRGVRFVA